jgi:WD40 repeat protein
VFLAAGCPARRNGCFPFPQEMPRQVTDGRDNSAFPKSEHGAGQDTSVLESDSRRRNSLPDCDHGGVVASLLRKKFPAVEKSELSMPALPPCTECGAELCDTEEDVLCMRCLLSLGLAAGGNSTDSIAAPVPLGITAAPLGAGFSDSRFGDYELLEEIARGGMGIVYKARQVSLGRNVALKMILAGQFAAKEFVQRFRGEAAAAAILQHPNIVAIHEVGVHENQHFFSMDYVEGRNMAQLVGSRPLPPHRAARYVKLVAGAVHYAHQQGILHRDLKPSNVLIDAATDQPRVTDFGLARRLDGESSLTLTGQVLGSPNFMPPEQASSSRGKTGRHSDVYGVGGILYFLLTARAPFQAGSIEGLVTQVLNAEPVPPRLLNPVVPHDLETICLKCLEKEPTKRYPTAQALTDELDRFLNHEPIQARPLGKLGKAWRWCRRKPALAIASGLALAALLTIALSAPIVALRIGAAETKARLELWSSRLAQARAERVSSVRGGRAASLEAIATAAQMRPSLELRNEAIAALALTDIGSSLPLREGVGRFERAILDSDFTRYALFQETGGVKIHAVEDNRVLAELSTPSYHGAHGSFSADGNWFAAVLGDKVFLWSLSRFNTSARSDFPPVREAARSATDAAQSATFAPDSRRFAVAGQDNSIHFYDLETGEVLPPLPVGDGPYCIEFDPTGKRLAVMMGGKIEVWDLDQRTPLHATQRSVAGTVMNWHPGGRQLAIGYEDGEVKLLDTLTGYARPLPAHTAHVSDVRFDPAGTLMVSIDWDGRTQFWDGTLGHPWFQARGTGRCQFSTDGARIGFLRDHVGRLEIASIVRSEVYHQWTSPLVSHPHLRGVDVSPNGRWFAYADRQHWFLCEVQTGRHVAAMAMPEGSFPQFHPTGRAVFTVTPDAIWQWPIRSEPDADPLVGTPVALVSSKGSEWQRTAVSTDGKLMAIAGHYRNVLVNLDDHARPFEFAHGLRESFVVLSPNKEWAATASHRGSGVTVWNTSDGKLIRHVIANENAQIAVSPDGRTLATATARECCWWDTETWQLRKRFPLILTGEPRVAVAFSADGKLFAMTVDQQRISLFDPANGAELATLTPPQLLNAEPLVFSADGSYLLAGTKSGVIAAWDLDALRRELATLKLDW